MAKFLICPVLDFHDEMSNPRNPMAHQSTIQVQVALRLGLPPFSRFEQTIAKYLSRVPPNQRSEILEDLYTVAAQMLVKQAGNRGVRAMIHDGRRRRFGLTAC